MLGIAHYKQPYRQMLKETSLPRINERPRVFYLPAVAKIVRGCFYRDQHLQTYFSRELFDIMDKTQQNQPPRSQKYIRVLIIRTRRLNVILIINDLLNCLYCYHV